MPKRIEAFTALNSKAEIFISESDKDAFFDTLLELGISASAEENTKLCGIVATLSLKNLKKIIISLDKLNIKVYIISIKGIFALAARLRYRLGVLFGIALFALLLWMSTLFVWRVDVVGAEKLSTLELKDRLSELGVGVGTPISELKASEIGGAFLLSYPELSWASLDITGTTATLTVRETQNSDIEKNNESLLLVASEAGIVESILVYGGKAAVSVGSTVNAGDVLISGFISGSGLQYSDPPSLRTENAVGSVLARVEREFCVYVPLAETRYENNGETNVYREINIFGKILKSGNLPTSENCSVSVKRYNVTLFGIIELPIEVTETVSVEATETQLLRTSDQAETEAKRLAYDTISENIGEGEALWIKMNTENTKEGCKVFVAYSCIAEIAIPYRLASNGE